MLICYILPLVGQLAALAALHPCLPNRYTIWHVCSHLGSASVECDVLNLCEQRFFRWSKGDLLFSRVASFNRVAPCWAILTKYMSVSYRVTPNLCHAVSRFLVWYHKNVFGSRPLVLGADRAVIWGGCRPPDPVLFLGGFQPPDPVLNL